MIYIVVSSDHVASFSTVTRLIHSYSVQAISLLFLSLSEDHSKRQISVYLQVSLSWVSVLSFFHHFVLLSSHSHLYCFSFLLSSSPLSMLSRKTIYFPHIFYTSCASDIQYPTEEFIPRRLYIVSSITSAYMEWD